MAGVLVFLTALASPAVCQVLEGHVVDSLSGIALGASYVILLDSTGSELSRTLTDRAGRFQLRAPAPGRYRLSARRIGFRPTTSGELSVTRAGLSRYALRVPSIPVTLTTVVVEGKPRCSDRGAEGSGLATVWQQVREALEAVSWTASLPRYRYNLSLYERMLDPLGRSVLRERTSSHSGYYETPFKSAPPQELVRSGYVTGSTGDRLYLAPDASVLLSDPFAASHCFSLVENRRDAALIGLAFRPTPDRDLPEITGTLWVDRHTAELRSLAFAYINLPPDLRQEVAGGEDEFLRLPSGEWIIKRWSIRIPIMRRAVRLFEVGEQYSLTGIQETGGQVLRITDRAGEPVYSADLALLEGWVYDSLARVPLESARVRIAGTDLTTATDAAGRFDFAQPLDGTYQVVFDHPVLDSVGYTPRAPPVTLSPGERTTVRLAVPAESSITATLCDGRAPAAGQGVLLGSVRDPAGRPRAGTRVRVSWYDVDSNGVRLTTAGQSLEMETDTTGLYLFCGVPARSPLVLGVAAASGTAMQALRLDANRIAAGTSARVTRAGKIWRRDVTVGVEGSATLLATVTDSLDQPLANAVVQLLGTGSLALTDARGKVSFANLPPGSGFLVVRRLGYRPLDRAIDLLPGDTLTLSPGALALAPLPVLLDTAIVTGSVKDRTLALTGFYERRREGFGDFITRDEFDRYAPRTVYDIARRLPVLDVRPNPNYNRTFSLSELRNAQGGPQGLVDAREYLLRSRRQTRTQCAVQIYLDGTFIGTDETVQIDAILEVNQIEAVEAYAGGADVPPQFNSTGSECGVIAIWTRR